MLSNDIIVGQECLFKDLVIIKNLDGLSHIRRGMAL